MAGEPAAQPAEERVVEKGLQSETQQERANEATATQQNGVEEERAPELPPRPLPAAYPNGKRVSIQQPVQFIAPPFQQPCDPYELSPSERNCERPSNPKWDKVKFGLYLLSLVVSGVIFGLGITIGIHTAPYMTEYYSYPSEIELGTSGAAAGLAIIFVCLDLLRICLSTARRGLHPGLLVTFNLFIWLVAVVAIVITTIFATDNTDSYDYYEYPDGLEGTALAAKTSRYEKALLGFDCCLLALHFILFVGACAETSQHNKTKRKTVYVAVMPNGEQIPAQPGQAVVYQPVNQGYTVVQMPPTNGVQWTAPGRSVTSTSQWVPAPAPQVNQYGGYYAPVQPTMTYAVPQQQGYYVSQKPSSSVLAVPKPALKSRRAAPAVAEASSSSSSSPPPPPPKEPPAQNTTEPVAGK